MNKNHRWYSVAAEWLEGKPLQYRSKYSTMANPWFDLPEGASPNFDSTSLEWRVKSWWQNEKDAHKQGKKIQIRTAAYGGWGEWKPCPCPLWIESESMQYRVAPDAPKVPTVEESTKNLLDYLKCMYMDDPLEFPMELLHLYTQCRNAWYRESGGRVEEDTND